MTSVSNARIIDGKALAEAVREDLAHRVAALREAGKACRLDALIVEGNQAGAVYARNQASTCDSIGLDYTLHELGVETTEAALLEHVRALNEDADCTGIMVHLPLPEGICMERVQAMIAPHKDVEGVNPANIGGVIYGQRTLVPCTAAAAMHLLESTGIELAGAEVVVVGASGIVGKPVAVLLMRAEATVTSTNIHTQDLAAHCAAADVVIAAAGVPGLIKAEHVKAGAVVIDVGINRVMDEATGNRRTVGDVDQVSVLPKAAHLSPVPGGVGPVTVAMLLRNTVEAAERH